MKFGIMIMPQHPRSDSPKKRFEECVELTRLARDAGLDSIACGQHFLAPPYQNIQSIPLLSRLAAESGSMSLVLSVILLPLFSPVGVAEDVASLDVISGGRVIIRRKRSGSGELRRLSVWCVVSGLKKEFRIMGSTFILTMPLVQYVRYRRLTLLYGLLQITIARLDERARSDVPGSRIHTQKRRH